MRNDQNIWAPPDALIPRVDVRTCAVLLALGSIVTGCTSAGPDGAQIANVPAPTIDAATRSAPVVVGRPARVFVFASVDTNCKPMGEPKMAVTEPPAKGDISMRPGQGTTLASTAQGTCIGAKATGTGVYYTARAGTTGSDRFSLTATLASGETATRVFEVTIAE